MTVLGITTSSSPYQAGASSRAAQARQDFKDLGAALTSGDLATAQAAFDSLQQNIRGGGKGKSQNPDNGRQLLATLGSALESGNLTEAQQLYAKLQQNMGEIKGKGHDHSHKGGRSRNEGSVVTAPVTTTPATGQDAPAATGSTATEGAGISIMA